MGYIENEIWKEYLGENLDMFRLIAKSFLDSYRNFKQTLFEYNKTNTSLLYNEIHSIKGITLNLGMKKLYEITSTCCEKIKSNQFTNGDLITLVDIFSNSYEELESIVS